jgi:hypothetical protein
MLNTENVISDMKDEITSLSCVEKSLKLKGSKKNRKSPRTMLIKKITFALCTMSLLNGYGFLRNLSIVLFFFTKKDKKMD